jgi:spore coat polysaccharide biosynthesis predicted glycosyltransferase SpsG
VVSLHDLGRGRLATTLAVDGSVTSPAAGWPAARTLRGLPFAVIRPPQRARVARVVTTVLISLGGGPRASWARAVTTELLRRRPDLVVFATGSADAGADRVAPPTMVAAPDGLAPWLARVDVAIVGGGVSLYEAVAAGVPTVAVAVVPAQRPTIRGFAARRLTVDAGGPLASLRALARRIGDRFERIAADAAGRRYVRQAGPRAVDGRGARRVAREIAAVVEAARRG